MQKFPRVFDGLGRLKGEPINIELVDGAKPYQLTTPRRVSIPYLPKLKEELEEMEKIGVIKPVKEPTAWCHPIVVVPKQEDKIRICLDLTKLNVNVKREVHQLPSVEETLAKIGKGKWFAKLDANHGYWQMPLNEDSQKLCTFITPFGRYFPTRGPFGLTSMPEIFSRKMDIMVEGLSNVVKSMDDFLVFAEDEGTLEEKVDELLKIMQEWGMTLNRKKCIFKAKKVQFLGYNISAEGIYPVEERLQAIKKMNPPKNLSEFRSFLGMAQQLARFCPQYSETANPLRDLLSTKNCWVWTEVHTNAFQKIKEILCTPPVLAMYDVNRKTKIRTDGSKLNGISVILLQQHDDNIWKPVDCRSRYLSTTEKGYAPIEIEMLAISWGINRMSLYLSGLPTFIVETDHKPLIPILNNKSLQDMSPRIQRMRMCLLQYNFFATHIRGKDLIDADCLSRSPVDMPTEVEETAEKEVEMYVNLVYNELPATEERLNKIKLAVKEDEELQETIREMQSGWKQEKNTYKGSIRIYWKCKDELSLVRGLLLKGRRIVIPKTLRRGILQEIHMGHLGENSCKSRARQSVYWPGMNKDIENLVSNCHICISMLPNKSKNSMIIRELPTRPWEMVGSDLFEWSSKKYVIITDYYSGYPEVYLLKNEKASSVIEVTKDVFARHGIAAKVVSDNGPQFKAMEYKEFAKQWQFDHDPSSPYYPQSNGLAESSVKSVKRLLMKTHKDRSEFLKGLLILRNTPRKNGLSSAQILFGRQLRDNLPTMERQLYPIENRSRNIMQERIEMKKNYDTKSSKVPEKLAQGQKVVIQHNSKEWNMYGKIIKEVYPHSYIVENENGQQYRRNIIHIRKINGDVKFPTRVIGIHRKEAQAPETREEETNVAHIPNEGSTEESRMGNDTGDSSNTNETIMDENEMNKKGTLLRSGRRIKVDY